MLCYCLTSVADGGATIILIRRRVTLIVIIVMQPCLWNADYAIMRALLCNNHLLKVITCH